eukprot:TRINITY_DN6747_c0_g1_i3.p1 TRINITY_DN6747_c0_g1~~TRINITY_DN6747_c0_g1_i3.p1  ORF type:complete len:159 (-),score=31.67 TRINITY_DN6747_c0_g1_i3:53-529(-)
MGFTMPHITILIAAGVVGLALLFQIIGVATPGWIVVSASDYKSGLWESCVGGRCTKFDDVGDSAKACRAFGILGIFAMAASFACGLLICFMSDMKIFTLLAPLAAAAGAFCAMIEFAVYAGEADSTKYLDYSFALTVVAFVLCGAAAVLFFLGRSKSQ